VPIASESAAATRALGRRLGAAARAGDVILIEGPLGAGKTVLVQGLAEGLGATDIPTSPTFVLVRHHRGRLELVHADLYRLESREEIDALDLLELAEAGVLAVEWAERAPWLDGGSAARLRVESTGPEERTIEVVHAPDHLAAALGGGPPG